MKNAFESLTIKEIYIFMKYGYLIKIHAGDNEELKDYEPANFMIVDGRITGYSEAIGEFTHPTKEKFLKHLERMRDEGFSCTTINPLKSL